MEPVSISQLLDRSRNKELIAEIAQLIGENGWLEGSQLEDITTLDDRSCQMVIQSLVPLFAYGRRLTCPPETGPDAMLVWI